MSLQWKISATLGEKKAVKSEDRKRKREDEDGPGIRKKPLRKVISAKVTIPHMENVVRLETTNGTRVIPNRPRNEFLLKGPADLVAAARLDIAYNLDNLKCELAHPMEERVLQWILHNDADTMRALCKDQNVAIHFENGEVRITGKKRSCDFALVTIKSIVIKIETIPVKEVVIVPLDKVGYVAGQQFTNKIRLENTYGVIVTIPPKDSGSNEIILEGLSDRVVAARVDIIDNLQLELEFPVEDSAIQWIHAYEGVTMQTLSKDHNVEIDFGDGKVRISGKKRSCEDAWSTLKSIITQIEQMPKIVTEKVTVPLEMVGLVSGPQFTNKIRLEDTYGVEVTIPAKGSGCNEILLVGFVEQVAAAKVDILENVFTLEKEIDGRFIGSIIGHQKEGVIRLSRDHGDVRIKFEDSKRVIITGKKEHCEAAWSEIQSIVAKLKDNLPVDLEQAIEPDFIGLIIGRGGEGVMRLSNHHGVDIQFKDKKAVIITGKRERCEAALSEINSIIKKRKLDDEAKRQKEAKQASEEYWKKDDVVVRRAEDAKSRWSTGTTRVHGHKASEIGPQRPRVTTVTTSSTIEKSSKEEKRKIVWP